MSRAALTSSRNFSHTEFYSFSGRAKIVYIYHPPSETKARQWAAALQAAAIPCTMRRGPDGRTILVIPGHWIDAATSELATYETVNCDWPSPLRYPQDQGKAAETGPTRSETGNELILIAAAGLLLPIWHFFLHLQGRADAFISIGAATRSLMLENGEWWRSITALTLHVDGVHVVSNTAWGILLGGALALQTGAGGALLLGLLSGIGGNLLATVISEDPRSAIGASTAVLGLIGILAGLRFLQTTFDFPSSARGLLFSRQSWLALLAGLAALAFLGSAQHTDLTGHLTGFICGLLLAPAAWIICRRKTQRGPQLIMFLLFITILAAGWGLAVQALAGT